MTLELDSRNSFSMTALIRWKFLVVHDKGVVLWVEHAGFSLQGGVTNSPYSISFGQVSRFFACLISGDAGFQSR